MPRSSSLSARRAGSTSPLGRELRAASRRELATLNLGRGPQGDLGQRLEHRSLGLEAGSGF